MEWLDGSRLGVLRIVQIVIKVACVLAFAIWTVLAKSSSTLDD